MSEIRFRGMIVTLEQEYSLNGSGRLELKFDLSPDDVRDMILELDKGHTYLNVQCISEETGKERR